mmetsp:Transcript_101128/g.291120  ORF Transcript_101128/g.291120 Transcript_101128/m.291120 type:complete len:251 (+) Transcript_101128:330-1082(+)
MGFENVFPVSSEQVVQTNLFVAAALHVLNADPPLLQLGTPCEMCIESVLEYALCKVRVFHEDQSPIDPALTVLEPIFVCEENVLAVFLEDISDLLQGIVFGVDKCRIRVQHHYMGKGLGTLQILSEHQVLFPIEILAFVLSHTLSHILHPAIPPLPASELGLRRTCSKDHGVAMTPGVLAVCCQDGAEPRRSGTFPAPNAGGVHQHGHDDQHTTASWRASVHDEFVFFDKPSWPGSFGHRQSVEWIDRRC